MRSLPSTSGEDKKTRPQRRGREYFHEEQLSLYKTWPDPQGAELILFPARAPGLAFGSGVGRVSEEAFAVCCPLELALEAAPQAYILLTL